MSGHSHAPAVGAGTRNRLVVALGIASVILAVEIVGAVISGSLLDQGHIHPRPCPRTSTRRHLVLDGPHVGRLVDDRRDRLPDVVDRCYRRLALIGRPPARPGRAPPARFPPRQSTSVATTARGGRHRHTLMAGSLPSALSRGEGACPGTRPVESPKTPLRRAGQDRSRRPVRQTPEARRWSRPD